MKVSDLFESSIINGKDVSNEPRWKQTSMDAEKAKAKYGKENVRVKSGGLRNGADLVEILEMHEKDVDMLGKKHEKCGGTFKETSIQDDMHGTLHCSKCNKQINRRPVKEGWKGAVAAVAATAGLVGILSQTNPAYVDGQQIPMALGNPTKDAKLVTDDDGKKIWVWEVPMPKGGTQKVYKAVKKAKVSEGRWVKGPGGTPLGKDGKPTPPKGPRTIIAAYSDAYWDKKEQESNDTNFVDPSSPIDHQDGDQINSIVQNHFNMETVDWTFSGKGGSRKPQNTTLATRVIRVTYRTGPGDDLGVPDGTQDTEYIVVGRNYKKPKQIDFVDYGQNASK